MAGGLLKYQNYLELWRMEQLPIKQWRKLRLLRYVFWHNALKWQSADRCPSALHLRPYDQVAICQSQKVTFGTYFYRVDYQASVRFTPYLVSSGIPGFRICFSWWRRDRTPHAHQNSEAYWFGAKWFMMLPWYLHETCSCGWGFFWWSGVRAPSS